MGKVLQEYLTNFRDKVKDCIKTRKQILVTTHIDCDGITSGSIITNALIKAGAKCTVRTTNEFKSLPEEDQKNIGRHLNFKYSM